MKKAVIVVIIICLSIFAVVKVVEASENQPVSPTYAKGYEEGYEQAIEDVQERLAELYNESLQNDIYPEEAADIAGKYEDNKSVPKELRKALPALFTFTYRMWNAICDLDDNLEPEYKEE